MPTSAICFAYAVVVDDGDDGRALLLALTHDVDNDGAIIGIERGGWLIEQEDRMFR